MRLVLLWSAFIVAEAINPGWSSALDEGTQKFAATSTLALAVYAFVLDLWR